MDENKRRKEVKEKIRNWLLEEEFKINQIPNQNAIFNFVAEDTAGRKVNILQPVAKVDQIVIATNAVFSEEQQQKLMIMQSEARNQFLWSLRFALLNCGVGVSPITAPLKSVSISNNVYYDGLTKDNFMHRLFDVRRALILIFWMIEREFGEPEPASKQAYVS